MLNLLFGFDGHEAKAVALSFDKMTLILLMVDRRGVNLKVAILIINFEV
jgi:hypothetical protein